MPNFSHLSVLLLTEYIIGPIWEWAKSLFFNNKSPKFSKNLILHMKKMVILVNHLII